MIKIEDTWIPKYEFLDVKNDFITWNLPFGTHLKWEVLSEIFVLDTQ